MAKKRIQQEFHMGGSFTPAGIAGLDLWLESYTFVYKDPTTNPKQFASPNDSVWQWADPRNPGSLYANQNTAAARPLLKSQIFGQMPGLLFDGVDDTMLVTIAAQAAHTIFTVCKAASNIAASRVIQAAAATAGWVYNNGGGLGMIQNQAAGVQAYGGNALNANIVTANVASAASFNGYLNGALAFACDPDDTFTTSANINLASSGAGAFGNTYIGAVIRYTRTLSAAEQKAVEQYLGQKYAIAVS